MYPLVGDLAVDEVPVAVTCRVLTLQRLWSVHARRPGRQRRPGPPVHDDLVRREFTANRPNQLWPTDILVAGVAAWAAAVGAAPTAPTAAPSTRPARASSTCARSRMPARSGSS